MYDLTTNVTTIMGLFSMANNIVGTDMVIIFLDIMIFTIVFMATGLREENSMASVVYASWVTSISSVFITIFMEADPMLFLIPMVMLLSSIFLYAKKGGN